MMPHFADRLIEACERKSSRVCVGLDPVIEKLPSGIDRSDPIRAIEVFCREVIDAVREHAVCIKPQSACFERYGHRGVKLHEETSIYAQRAGLLVINDAKRGDIGISAAHYAVACLEHADALTINTYFGPDGIEPFVTHAAAEGKGLFALVRTSNPGGDAIQGLKLTGGGRVCDAAAKMVHEVGRSACGRSTYSLLGAVVGATKPDDAATLRELMPHAVFLVPGYGAQGAGADDVRACFNHDKLGAIITASRSVIYAHEKSPGQPWQQAVRDAAAGMREEINEILG
ncbi:MAG: orotidine-5'-phosphate decarboxylase [Phycisphaera sp.]|nr:orotidine-5'-phosphate decarboxylase [Phycisphaera sp.]